MSDPFEWTYGIVKREITDVWSTHAVVGDDDSAAAVWLHISASDGKDGYTKTTVVMTPLEAKRLADAIIGSALYANGGNIHDPDDDGEDE